MSKREPTQKHLEELAHRLTGNESVDWQQEVSSSQDRAEEQWVRNLELVERVRDAARTEWEELQPQADATQFLDMTRNHPSAAPSTGASTLTPNSTPTLQTWGHLNLLETLGEGGFGEVYRAWDTRLNRPVALKLLRGSAEGDDAKDAILAEARLLARVEHPNVARVYGVECHNDRVGIWMELVEGTDLRSLINESGPMDPADVATIGVQIASALNAVHAAGVIHRDVKPQNIVRTPEGRAVLMDLGAAQWRRTTESDAPALSGTPRYMAPEQLLSQEPAGPRTDVYGLGVTLFYALTGDLPVSGTLREICAAHANQRRASLTELRPELAQGAAASLVDIVDWAIHVQPTERIATAEALQQSLAEWQRKTTPAARVGRGWMAAALLATAAVIALLILKPDVSNNGLLSGQVQMSSLREGRWVPLAPNEAITSTDDVQLSLQLTRKAHVYVINRDARGSAVVLFPMAGGGLKNPLAPGRSHVLPGLVEGSRKAWTFSATKGREDFLVIASAEPLNEFEEQLNQYATVDVGGGLSVRPMDGALWNTALLQDLRGVTGLVDAQEMDPETDLFSLALQLAEEENHGLWTQVVQLQNSGQ